MTMELTAVDLFVAGKLRTDPTFAGFKMTGYFAETPPNNQQTPYVLWTWYAGSDDSEVAGVRIMTEAVYLVFVVDRVRNWSSLQAAANQLDTLLHRSSGPAGTFLVRECVREAPYRRVENLGSAQWRSVGGRYRFYIS